MDIVYYVTAVLFIGSCLISIRLYLSCENSLSVFFYMNRISEADQGTKSGVNFNRRN